MNIQKLFTLRKGNFQFPIFNPLFKILTIAIILSACNGRKNSFDASGTFEAEETIISSEAVGTIKQLNIEEGKTLDAERVVGNLISTKLHLKKKKLKQKFVA